MRPRGEPGEDLRRELEETRARLAEAEEALAAIRRGEVDAVVVEGPRGVQLYALKGPEEPYRLLVEQMGEGALTINSEGLVLYANRALARLLGLPAGRVVGTRLDAFFDPSQRPALESLLQHAGASGWACAEIPARSADHRDLALRLGVTRLDGDSHEALGVVATDLTQERLWRDEMQRQHVDLEEKVQARTADLRTANRELQAFNQSVAHDLRGPLRAVDGFSLVLLEDYGDRLDAEGREALRRVRAASQLMGRLIDELLRLSRITRAELRLHAVDLSALAREVAAMLQESDRARAVRWEIQEGMQACGDGELVRIVLRALMENAWKFTGATRQAQIRVGALAGDGAREYFVADNGAGFDMALAGRLFGPFQRLHRVDEFPGIGIGLALAHRIVERHGGRIRAEGVPGEGATIYFTLGE